MFMPWLQEYCMNIAEIDEQHKNFVRIINDLSDAIDIGSEDIVLGDILLELESYAQYHFSTEEKYFDMYNYTNAIEHKKQHADIIAKIDTYQAKYQNNTAVVSRELLGFVKDWFYEHTQGHDKKYVDCFHEHGLK